MKSQYNMTTLPLLVLCLLVIVSLMTCAPTGVKVIVTEDGINRAISETVPDLMSLVQIPDIIDSQDLPLLGEINFWLTDFVIDHIDILPLSIGFKNGAAYNETTITSENVVVALMLNWRYQQKNLPVVSGHGTCKVTIDGGSLSMGLRAASIDNSGRPILASHNVTVRLQKLDLKIHGGISGEVANVLSTLFSKLVKNAVQNAIANTISDAVDITLNQKIQDMPTSYGVAFGPIKLLFDYSLNSIIVDPRGFVVTAFKARFLASDGNVPEYPFTPAAMPDIPQSQDVTGDVLLSDFVINSGTYAAYSTGQLKLLVTPDMVPAASPIKLDTASIGKVVPQMLQHYPQPLPVQLAIGTSTYPTVIETPNGALIQINITSAVQVIENSTVTTAFVMNLSLFAQVSNVSAASLNNGAQLNVTGTVSNLQFDMYATDSTIGDVNLTTLKMLFNAMVINGYGKKYIQQLASGYIIDLSAIVPGLQINNPVVKSNNGFVSLGGSVSLHPPKKLLVPYSKM